MLVHVTNSGLVYAGLYLSVVFGIEICFKLRRTLGKGPPLYSNVTHSQNKKIGLLILKRILFIMSH